MRITVVANLDNRSSWGQVLAELVSLMIASGIDVKIRSLRKNVPFSDTISDRIVTGYRSEKWEIYFGDPDYFPTPRKKTAYYTRWNLEISPKRAIAMVNAAEFVIVPSKWDFQMFLNHGCKRPIHIVRFGFNNRIFHSGKKSSSKLIFGVALNSEINTVLNAFNHAILSNKDVNLKIKAFTGAVPEIKDSRIEVNQLSRWHEVAEWYRSIDCFLSVGRTGSGLSVIQAMACGVPTIGMAVGTRTAFLNNESGFPVPSEKNGSAIFNPFYNEIRRLFLNPEDLENPRKALESFDHTWAKTYQEFISAFESQGVIFP